MIKPVWRASIDSRKRHPFERRFSCLRNRRCKRSKPALSRSPVSYDQRFALVRAGTEKRPCVNLRPARKQALNDCAHLGKRTRGGLAAVRSDLFAAASRRYF